MTFCFHRVLPAAVLLCARILFAQGSSTQTQPVQSIVVTGTFDPVDLNEMDRAISRLAVRPDELLMNSWLDALRLDPSVSLGERAPNGVQSDVSIRGGTFGQTLVMLNGVRMNDPQSGHHNMDVPAPLESIDRIEVLRGSGSALYGSDAVGGVVNIITRIPEASELVLRTSVGNFGVNQQSGSLTLAAPRASEQLTFSRDFSSGFAFDRDYRNLSFASTSHLLSPLGAGDIVLAYGDRPFGADQFYGNYPSWENTKSWIASLRQDLGPGLEAVFSFRRHSDLFVLFRDQPQIYTNHHSDETYDAALRKTRALSGNASLHFGGEFYNEGVESTNLGRHDRNRGAAYASLDVRALRRFSFSVGAREDVYGSLSGQFNPNLAAGYWLSHRLRLRGGVSRAFRLPTYTDLYYSDPANVGNAQLKPEHAWDFEGGLEFQITPRLRAEATVFQRNDRDGIDFVRRSTADLWQATNFDHLDFTGFEGALVARMGATQSLDLRYSALRGVQDYLNGFYSKYAFNYPTHSAEVQWRAALRQFLVRTRVGVEQRVGQSPFGVWDFYAAWTRPRLRPFVQLTNLTATHYQEIYGVNEPGRAVVGGVEIRVAHF